MNTLLAIIWLHWFSDFILQTRTMAENKSTSNKWLLSHISVYTLPFFIFGWKFAILNGVAHGCIDWCTSRLSSKMYKQNRIHNFWVVIGFDQALHMSCLILSWGYLL